MDLAMHFGVPADELARRMTEREFRQWMRRSREHWLPAQRIEWYLAQISQWIAVTLGGVKNVTPDDFMLTLEKPVDELTAAKQAFGFNPKVKKTDGE